VFLQTLSLFATGFADVTMEQEEELAAVRDDLIQKEESCA